MTQPPYIQSDRPRRKFGRLPNNPAAPRLHLARFVDPTELVAPTTVDYLSRVSTWPMHANDTLGTCTAAGAAHIEQVWSGYGQGHTWTATESDVLAFYSRCSGYVVGNPSTDQGAILQDCLKLWRTEGLAGRRLAAFFSVDPHRHDLVRLALWLFGAVYVGVEFPRVAMDQLEAGQPWSVTADDGGIDGGHCVHLGAAHDGMYEVTTWGQRQLVTTDWWDRYVSECWTPVSTTWARAGRIPSGLDADAVNAEFTALTGEPGPLPGDGVIDPPLDEDDLATGPVEKLVTPGERAAMIDNVDDDFAQATRAWLARYHVGANRTYAEAATAWLVARGL